MTSRLFRLILIGASIALSGAAPSLSRAGEPDTPALASALSSAGVTLDTGLRTSEQAGKPISAKFEIEDGKFQLSVYTLKGIDLNEVILDAKTGAIVKVEQIDKPEDLASALGQRSIMEKARISLLAAVQNELYANRGARAVSVFPDLEDDHPVARITLRKGAAFVKVTERLD